MTLVTEIEQRDGPELAHLRPPIQRAAYSDRTAWLMAVFADLAYIKFETSTPDLIQELAVELAEANGVKDIAERLIRLQEYFKSPSSEGEDVLKEALLAAGFELVGTFYNQTLDVLRNTEGFVARKIAGEGREIAVLSIRGTTSPQDWMNNCKVGLKSIDGGRKVHSGFYRAFMDAEQQIETLLDEVRELPLFVTGHSMGGAVAVMATWRFKRDSLAACYTFGCPRVGNHRFSDAFHTPIYRVVNSFDPVTMVPPSGRGIMTFKFIFKMLSKFFIAGGFFEWLVELLLKVQGYRHTGYLRHMTAGEMDESGRYTNVEHYTQFGAADRIVRLYHLILERKLKRLDKYHTMGTYRRKLRSRALDRAPQ
jgi:triacylglycerol lipase